MHQSSVRRRSSSNPVRISAIEREDRSLTRNDQRRTQTGLKPRGISIGETSHIPRPRFRSSSMDRAGSLGRKSYLKATGKTPLCQSSTSITPVRLSTKPQPNIVLTASTSRLKTPLLMGRSPSGDRNIVGTKGSRKDTRPLTDKTYQVTLLNKIDNFFCVYQCSAMLNSNSSLKPITLKMFVEVSNFLLKYLDIKQDLTLANYIDELPKYAKKLHYPGASKIKSWLKTANTIHSWHYVLGWIGWLVEACQVRQIAYNRFELGNLPFTGTEQQAQSSSMELQALLECYEAWNDEKLDEEEKLLNRYLQDILVQQGITDDDITKAHEQLEEEKMKLQVHEKESQKFDEKIEYLQHKLASLRAKESKELNNIKTMEAYLNQLSTETNQLNAEREVLKEQIRIGHTQYEELISTVKNQPMSKMEKETIIKKCTEIQNYIHQFDEHLKDYQKELYTLDIKLASFSNNLNKAILAYNKEVFMHIDSDVRVNFDELKLPEKGLLNQQMMEIMEEKVALIKIFNETLMEQCNETESLICSETTKLKNLQEKIKSLPDENKLKQDTSHINKMKADTEKKKTKLIKQIEDLRNEIKEMQNVMPDLEAVDLEIEEAQDKLNAVMRRKTFLEEAAKRFFRNLYKIIGEHKNELYNILTK